MLTISCKKKDPNSDSNSSINDPIPTIGVVFNPNLTYGTVTDIDGNVYKTIKIDSLTWMAENLKTTRYRNGDQIPNVTDKDAWYNLASGAYCDYDNNVNNSKTYGRLYNYFAVVDTRNIAPSGWHVATGVEWGGQLLIHYGGSMYAAPYLKEVGTTHWGSSNNGNNESGFTALPGGGRTISWGSSSFDNQGSFGGWWCICEPSYVGPFMMMAYIDEVTSDATNLKRGYSVRCVKD